MSFPNSIPSYTPADPAKTLDEDNHTQRHNSMQDDIVNIATKVGIDNSADTDSIDYRLNALENQNNQFVYDQSVSGTINGSNLVFTAQDSYVGGSLEVFINGLKQTRNVHYTETTPSVGTFTLDTAPIVGDIIRVNYMHTTSNGTTDADTVDGYHAAGILSAAEATMTAAIAAAKESLYPVGSIYINRTNITNPATLLGFGTWAQVTDKMIMAHGSTYTADGGAATHTHTLTAARAALEVTGTSLWFDRDTAIPFTATVKFAASGGSTENNASPRSTKLLGSTDSGSTIPPMIVAYIWERIA